MNIQVSDIGHVIQLSIAPVFLLTGVGTYLNVLTNRLARIIDRTRKLEDKLDLGFNAMYMDELDVLFERMRLINTAITLSVVCGLLICFVIAMLFLADTTDLALHKYVAAAFVASMLALTAAMLVFLREIFIASRSLQARRHVRPASE